MICSEKGWIRAVKGHVDPNGDTRYKEGDRGRFWLHADTTDKLVLFGTNGRFYTIPCDRIPRGRGHGESGAPHGRVGHRGRHRSARGSRTGADLAGRVERRSCLSRRRGPCHRPDPQWETGAERRPWSRGAGLRRGAGGARIPSPSVGENRKLLVFPVSELPTMTRGRGVLVQRYKDGGLSDAVAFSLAGGLPWRSGGRTRTERDLAPWSGKRAQTGRRAPKGFPRSNRFA